MRPAAALAASLLLVAGCLATPPAGASECGELRLAAAPETPLGEGETMTVTLELRNCGAGTLSLFVGGCDAFTTRLTRGPASWGLRQGAADESGPACPAVVGPPERIDAGETVTRSYSWNGTMRTDRGAYERAEPGPYEIVASARTESGTVFTERLRVEIAGDASNETTVAGWRVSWSPARLEGAPGETLPFAITLTPARADAEPGTLFAGNWIRFADGNTSIEIPRSGATFRAEALAGYVDVARFHVYTANESGNAEGPTVVALGGERHPAWTGRAKEPGPEGLTVTSEGGTIRVRYQLGLHGDMCNLAMNPQAKLVQLDDELHFFLAYSMTDVCATGQDPQLAEGETSGLPAGAYVVRAHLGMTACFCPAPPGGWETEERHATVGE